ncbi:unnamed protein product [Parascedosporium putredinis]|uniref:Cns1/TTC4 wheel domain-containing protein n=1 Tax=Parascedosporium putredinis TaxID=1442378 RepID=A0A9P1GYG0_9PEZI|nr:unnamed protein product [Parascedosporium putredinis]CAI7990655.1 unnamed protein product [Parascedosporium putredinis]
MKLTEISDAVEAESIDTKAEETPKPPAPAPAPVPAPASAPTATDSPTNAVNLGPTPPPTRDMSDILQDLNKSPLFMTDIEDNDDMEALKALAYEGTPLENAGEMKEQGNEAFKAKRWDMARDCYGKGINILWYEERRRARGEKPTRRVPAEGEEEEEEDPDAEETVRQQRALLETITTPQPRNVKAYYRSARALLRVDRIEEADDACARGLTVDPANPALLGLAAEIARRAATVLAKKRADEERAAQTQHRATVLAAAIAARGIRMRSTPKPPDMEDARVKLVPDEDDPASHLSFPALLLYPLHLETDFIKEFNETQTLADHLAYVFPLPWDARGEYTALGVECYVETPAGGLLKMGRKLPLLKVLAGGKVEVVDQVVRIFVVPKAGAADWVVKYKEQRAKEMAAAAGKR